MRNFHFLATLCLLMMGATLAAAADEGPLGGPANTPSAVPAVPPRAGIPGAGETGPSAAGGMGAKLPSDQASRKRLEHEDASRTKPSEFQKFVEATTGRLLPVFGANFFTATAGATAAQSPSAIDNVPVSADYVVAPGDQLLIRVWGSVDIDFRATVDRNGLISLPKVGTFNVAGVKASNLEEHLRGQIGRIFTNFSLNVTLGQLRGMKVFVVGPAQRPGVYTLPSQATMLSAMAAAGGPGPNGSMRRLSLRRDDRVISELDTYDFLVKGDKSKDIQLVAGDVVVFQPVGPRVAVTGAIDTPAIYELRNEQEPMGEVLRYSGGAPVLANPHRGQLERIDPTQSGAARFVEEFKLDASGLQKPLRDGDVLTLLPISPQFANAVTLKGHVAQPLRYPHKPGMRISDLIPDKEALIAPDFYRRKNLLVQVIDEDVMGDNAVASVAKKAPAALFDELNWDYAVIERLNERDLSTQVIPFSLGRAILQHDPAQDMELFAGDVVTVYSQKDVRVPSARQTRLVTLSGEVAAAGVYQLLPGESLRPLIARAGGLTPQAYVYGLEFSREETRQRQRENLAAATARLQALSAAQGARDAANRRGDPLAPAGSISQMATQAQMARLAQLQPNGRIALELSPDMHTLEDLPDLPLEHGDRINVPSRPGFVTVAGAVVNNNAYLWKPGRTAGDYVKLAGIDETADASGMFILRADGTVAGSTARRGFFGYGGIESQPLQPGDAVVVPNQLDYETWGRALVRNLKDWTQIFSQFGLGAAAIQTLRNN